MSQFQLWRPISTEPQDDSIRFVTDDDTDTIGCYRVRRMPDGRHFAGDVGFLEDMGIRPTHWRPA